MDSITRRDLLKKAAAASGAMFLAARAQAGEETNTEVESNPKDAKHSILGPRNQSLQDENPDSTFSPPTDHGNVDPFKYPYSFARKKTSAAGWARQVTYKDLVTAPEMAGVNMRLLPNGCRELHWHKSAEWAYMLEGKARITCVDYEGKPYIDDVGPGDLWYFPAGIPHSIQAEAQGSGCEFLLVFDDGKFNEYETFLISEWVARTPKDVLAKVMGVSVDSLKDIPKEEQFIFFAEPFRPLEEERQQAAGTLGYSKTKFTYYMSKDKPDKETKMGTATINDSTKFPISKTIATAKVVVKPGGVRELHWHPNSDEWQYYIRGKGRMTVFTAGNRARTMDFQAGDVGAVGNNVGHYIENTGTEDLEFLEVFKAANYQDLSFTEWISHTPQTLVMSHLRIDEATYASIPKDKGVVVPA